VGSGWGPVPISIPVPIPDWGPADQLQPRPPAARLDWWLDPDSLTRRLTRLAAGEFAVRVLQAGWQRLRADECAALDVAADSTGWVREVYLLGHGQPWVFARSVAAQSALHATTFAMERIGETSLGEVLFCNPHFTRGPLQLCHYPAACLPPEVRAPDLLARRSCFTRDALRVLVTEVGLPALWARLGIKAG